MSFPKKAITAASLLWATSALGCKGGPPRAVVHDLAAAAAVAEHHARWALVRFGTPAGLPHQFVGFVEEASAEGDDPHASAKRAAEIAFFWQGEAPRRVLVDLAPYPGLEGQSTRLFLNDHPLGRLRLRPGRRRYALDLPIALQHSGRNTVGFFFKLASPRRPPHGFRLSAVFYGAAVGSPADPSLAQLAGEEAAPPLSVAGGSEVPQLVQAGPSALRFAFQVPHEAELRFTPDLHPNVRSKGGSAIFRVTLEAEPEREQELWSDTLEAAERGQEVAVRIPAPPGSFVRLALRVEGAAGEAPVWGVWSAPRILGRPLGNPGPPPSPRGPDLEHRLGQLRKSLAGSNVLFIILDAAGARHFSCYRYARKTTPEIDRIASEGVLFEQAYSPVGFTPLAMGSAWTSQYPHNHDTGPRKLPKHRLTLAELLAANGVHTAGFVGNAMAGPAVGLDRGFAEFEELFRKKPSGLAAFRARLPGWFEANKQRQFFAYLHFLPPHFPYSPEPPFDTLFGPNAPLPREAWAKPGWFRDVNWKQKTPTSEEVEHLRRMYDGNLAFADREVGRFRKVLEDLGLWERTIVVIAADHGDALYEHGYIGHIGQIHEEILRIPLILRLPQGRGPAGLRVTGFVDLVDLAPTFADMFGLLGKGGSAASFKGRSLLPALFGAEVGKSPLFFRTGRQPPQYGIRLGRYKLIFDGFRGTQQLYDLEQDPSERVEVGAAKPLEAAVCRQRLDLWILKTRHAGFAEAAEAPEEVRLTPEQRENLKALGYIQ